MWQNTAVKLNALKFITFLPYFALYLNIYNTISAVRLTKIDEFAFRLLVAELRIENGPLFMQKWPVFEG